jgi:hypothetical protein
LSPVSALLDPAAERVFLCLRQNFVREHRRHSERRIIRIDALDEGTLATSGGVWTVLTDYSYYIAVIWTAHAGAAGNES